MNLKGHDAEAFVQELITRYHKGVRTRATWLNHYSWQRDFEAGLNLQDIDMVGIDGQLLGWILGRSPSTRSSADVVIPLLLDRIEGGTLAILGSTTNSLLETVKAIEERWPQWRVVWYRNGFNERPAMDTISSVMPDVDVLIIGLGAPTQDGYLKEFVHSDLGPMVVLTCGGWIDQFYRPTYYPSWAYQLRLTWLVRLLREPTRLWRRYTIDAMGAFARRKECVEYHRRLNVRPLAPEPAASRREMRVGI